MQRRFFLHSAATLAVSALGAAAGASAAQARGWPSAEFPSKPIRLLIAFPAGSATDRMVRTLAGNAAAILGQPVRVDNLPGAGGSLPLRQVQRAVADGYTLAQLPVSVFLPPSADGKRHAAAGEVLVPVIQVSGYALGLSLSPDSPLMSWERLADWAKDSLAGLMARLDAPASYAYATPAPSALGLGLIQNEPFGIGAPRGTAPEVVQRLHDAFAQAMAQENFRAG